MLRRFIGCQRRGALGAFPLTRAFIRPISQSSVDLRLNGIFKGTHFNHNISIGKLTSLDGKLIQEGTFVNGRLVEGVKETYSKNGSYDRLEGYFREGNLIRASDFSGGFDGATLFIK